MVDARRLFTEQERKQISVRVAEAERQTCAEIVCAVASESGRYDRSEGLLGFVLALLSLGLLHGLHQGGPGSWGAAQLLPLSWEMAALVVGFVLGNVLGTYFPDLRRPLIGRREMREETLRAAHSVFMRRRLGSTRQQAGVLLYLSLFERQVVVLADEGALQVLGPSGVGELRDLAQQALRRRQPVQAFEESVRRAAQLLAPSLPPDVENPNELPDELVILHPRP